MQYFNKEYFISSPSVVTMTNIPGLPDPYRGKVREMYELDGESMLIIVSDRLSAHDVVLPTGIRNKGKVLNGLSAYWFERTSDIIGNHMITAQIDEILGRLREAGANDPEHLRDELDGRSMIVRKARVYPVECIVRGYLFGSMWKEYVALCEAAGPDAETVNWNGFELPVGMLQGEKLPEAIFTASTKAADGQHDVNISFEEMCEILGSEEVAAEIRAASLALYARATEEAAANGIIICDTKFEFGDIDGRLVVIDEALTPDSSRFWDAKTYQPGRDQPSFDKQEVRDYLDACCDCGSWDKAFPGPELPKEIAEKTAEKYAEAYRRITGKDMEMAA